MTVRQRHRYIAFGVVALVLIAFGVGIAVMAQRSLSGGSGSKPVGFTPQGLLACTSASWCVTEGPGGGNGPPPKFWSWNGHSWQPMSESPEYVHDSTAYVNGLACTSSKQCVAVGYDEVNCTGVCRTIESTLTVEWNGKKWSQSPLARGPGGASAELDGVSCPNRNSCFAVGATTEGALVEHWNGDAWEVMANPLSHLAPFALKTWGLAEAALNSVSCSSVSECTAVGRFSELTPGIRARLVAESVFGAAAPAVSQALGVAVVERFDGAAWTASLVPYPPVAQQDRYPWPGNGFDEVSCASPTACLASGSAAIGFVFDWWDVSRWLSFDWPGAGLYRIQPLVSCPVSTWCMAVYQPSFASSSDVADASNSRAVVDVDVWTDARWEATHGYHIDDTIQYGTAGIYRDGNHEPELLSCSSPRFCLVAGSVGQNIPCAPSESYVARWDGIRWTVAITDRSYAPSGCK